MGESCVCLLRRMRPWNTFLSPLLDEKEKWLLWPLAPSGGVDRGGEWAELKERGVKDLVSIERMEPGRPFSLSSSVASSCGMRGLTSSIRHAAFLRVFLAVVTIRVGT